MTREKEYQSLLNCCSDLLKHYGTEEGTGNHGNHRNIL